MALSEFLRKTFADQRSKAHIAGQAILEYILVLVVTVSIILGLMYQFSSSFKDFTDLYFGNYIACLLETGELPTLGGETGPNQGTCAPPDFSFSGNMDIASDRGSSGSGDSSSSDSNSGSDSGGGGSGRLRPSRVVRGGGTSNGESSNSGSKDRPSKIAKRTDADKGANDAAFSDGSSSGGSGRGRTIRRKKVIFLDGKYVADKEKDKSPTLAKAKDDKKKGGRDSLRNPTFILDVPEAKKVADDDLGSGFNFGTFIKILLIFGIIIAIVIFLGGQAMQIKKSWQKSD